MRSGKILGLAMLFLLSTFAAFGQTSVGEVNGTVTDTSGASVAGASVKLTNQGTGVVAQATTNGDGHFVFINVQPGQYSMDAESSGFKSTRVTSFTVEIGRASCREEV